MSPTSPCASGPAVLGSGKKQSTKLLSPLKKLGCSFWVFFAAAFFFDFGFDLYFFLYNLFLLNAHFDERAIGFISSALTLGNVAGTLPVSMLARRVGVQRVLLFCFIVAPIISISRMFVLWMPVQIAFAFLTGVALSSWPVCFAPTIAKLTTEDTRVLAFSITFATGIGTGTLAGIAGGYIPGLFHSVYKASSLADGMRFVLAGASLIAMLGAYPISRLRLASPQFTEGRKHSFFDPFLLRFLPAFAVWSLVTGSFIPFAPVFFQKHLGISLQHVGVIFSLSELVQFCAVLLVPFVYRRTGSTVGIIIAQLATGTAVFALGLAHSPGYAVASYLVLTGAQFTAGPGFYGMLMSRVPDSERSSASAVQNIVGAVSQAGASMFTGVLITRFGYTPVFNLNASLAICAALLAFTCLRAEAGSPRAAVAH